MKKNKWKKEGITAEELLQGLRDKDKATLLYGASDSSTNALPKYDIPAVIMRNGSCGVAFDYEAKSLCFPSPSAVAATWNRNLAETMGQALAKEAIKANTDVILGPSLSIKRNPLCGDNFQHYSEDPVLTGKIGASFVCGIQSQGVGACIKDFVCSNQATSRSHMDAEVDMRALREIYLKPFAIAIKESDPWMVMTAYNKLNGVDCSDNPWLINEVLKKEFKFRGAVVSAWSSCPSPILSHNSGVDLEMPCFVKRNKDIVKAVKHGDISREQFEDSAKRVLTLALKAKQKPKTVSVTNEEQYQMMQDVAEESIILAKNEDNTLPLSSYKDTCVVGALAESFQIDGLAITNVNPQESHSLLREIAKYAQESDDTLAYAPGYTLRDDTPQGELDRLIVDAEELVSKYKRVIYVVGTEPGASSTKYDRPNMRLPHNQLMLYKHLYEHNKNIILVVVTGSPVELPMIDEVKAVVINYFGGEMSAKALHRVLIGRVNPSGRLPETWPISYSSVPSSCFYPIYKVPSPYKESIYVGYRYYQSAGTPVLFPFGHGLSYSRVVFKDLSIDKDTLEEGDKLEVSLKVHNLSRRIVKETIQLYVSPKGGNIYKPAKGLKDFVKVTLKEGETKEVKFALSFKDFALWGLDSEKWLVEEDNYDILIGKSVENVQLAGTVFLKSGWLPKRRMMISSYYYFTNKSLYIPGDYEFERILKHRIKNRSLAEPNSFNFESTVKSLDVTPVGRRIIKGIQEQLDPTLTDSYRKILYTNILEMPVRLLVNYGAPEHRLISALDMANGKILHAFFHLFGGRRK